MSAAPMLGYCRVSTDEQADSGLGLAAQHLTISVEADRRGWEVEWITDAAGGGSLRRPGIAEAMDRLSRGQAAGLVVAKLDRLSRSLLDFAGLMDRARQEGWNLVALDLGVDLGTPQGQLMANVMASFAMYERELIRQRTRDALAQAKARGQRLGAPSQVPPEVRSRVLAERATGRTLRAIANGLTADGIGTARGGRWHASTVAQVIQTEALDAEARRAAS